jgi:acid phosphatase type 7
MQRRRDLAAFLPLGNMQYEFGFYEDFLTSYDPSWGRLKRLSRPTPGDREYAAVFERSSPVGYFDYWNGNADAGPAGLRGRPYYSFDLGGWHVISLDSNCAFVGGCQAGSAQEQWLRADLKESATPCTLAYWHHPRFSSGRRGGNADVQPLWQALEDARAEVVLSAHDRVYERFAPQTSAGAADERGLRQFIVGTGGVSLDEFRDVPQSNSEARYKEDFGVIFLTLHENRYSWRFATLAGSFVDAGTAACH